MMKQLPMFMGELKEMLISICYRAAGQSKKLFVNEGHYANHFVGKLNGSYLPLTVCSSSKDRRASAALDIQICQTDALYRNNLLKFQRFCVSVINC